MKRSETTPGMVRLEHPSEAEIAPILHLIRPWEIITDPKFIGLDRIPEERPLLFVGNHTVIGIYDVPLMFACLYREKGIFLRALGDHAHWKVPVWRDFLSRFGVVDGNRENCARLMEAGETILVFPGGAREVTKRKGEKYRLIWKERTGFARMAIAHGCTIVPFAAVGAEESVDIFLDGNDLLASPIGPLLKRLGVRTDQLFPFVKGIGPTPLPRPVRMYFYFGEPIDTKRFGKDAEDEAKRFALRDETRDAVEAGITYLRKYRRQDLKKDLLPRVLLQLKEFVAERRKS